MTIKYSDEGAKAPLSFTLNTYMAGGITQESIFNDGNQLSGYTQGAQNANPLSPINRQPTSTNYLYQTFYKFGKIDFVDEMKEWFSNNSPQKSVLVGDLNIAPLAEDVWSTRQLRNVVSHTDIEREKLTAVINEGGWVDAVREYYGPKKILYSWWSYRARDWKASNRGRRLDHIWLSADIKDKVCDIDIMTQARGFEKPSDHVPMTIELAE